MGTTQKEKVEDRWKKDGYGYHHQQFIWNAICKYGWENVRHKVIVCETPEEMWEMEKKLIKEYDTTNPEHGYNISTGGEKSAFGNCLTEDTRRKLSESHKGRHFTEEHKRKLSESCKGKHNCSEETRHKMSESAKNRPPISDETRRKMSENKKGEKHPLYGNPRPEDVRRKISETKKNTPKPKWLTPNGEIRIMDKANVTHYHKDWILIQNQE